MPRPGSDRALTGDERPLLIVVKRRFFDQYLSGHKDTEYRRHRHPFTRRKAASC